MCFEIFLLLSMPVRDRALWCRLWRIWRLCVRLWRKNNGMPRPHIAQNLRRWCAPWQFPFRFQAARFATLCRCNADKYWHQGFLWTPKAFLLHRESLRRSALCLCFRDIRLSDFQEVRFCARMLPLSTRDERDFQPLHDLFRSWLPLLLCFFRSLFRQI